MKYTIRFSLKNTPTASLIRMRVSWQGYRLDIQTGQQIDPRYWDADSQRARAAYRQGKTTGAAINRHLAALEATTDDIFLRHQAAHTAPSPDQLRNALREALNPAAEEPQKPAESIFDDIDAFINTQSNQNGWQKGTAMRFRNLANHLRAFAPQLEYADLDEEGLHRFLTHLEKKGLRNTTLQKDLSLLRWFLRWASQHDRHVNPDYDTFRPRLKGTDGSNREIIYLEWDELQRLHTLDLSQHPTLSAVRDVFCFCCFSGLRYSDVAMLRDSDITDSHITVVTQKTRDHLRIELNDYSRAILDRYALFRQSDPRHRALPVISNQKMNNYLKEIAAMAQIDTPVRTVFYRGSKRIEQLQPKHQLITTHAARRTFVVNALRLGIPAEVIMKWTGHSDFKAMKPYVAIVDELKEKEMNKFNTLMQQSESNSK